MRSNKLNFIILATIILFSYYSQAVCLEDENLQKVKEYYLRGNIYYQQGKFKEAREQYQKALELSGGDALGKVGRKNTAKQPDVSEPILEQEVEYAIPGKITEYIIGKDDDLRISVWQNKDLDQDVIVRPDGKITCLLIGDIHAEGKTINALAKDITQRLGDYIKLPQVSIFLQKIGGERVIMLGQVASPGVLSVKGGKTIMEAIGMAGGFTRDSVPSSTVLIRGGFASPIIKRINLSRIFKGDLSQNILLQSQDIVFVPRKFISNLNYFLSQILEPLSK
ncbi:MAG: polysaccharide biosynthesis/export family protein, partial [Candidatus Omnitrophica bacterium]|nr:polysaccharide biosynthesis/export family protein [Candidatus Omnitrophota bacterium]